MIGKEPTHKLVQLQKSKTGERLGQSLRKTSKRLALCCVATITKITKQELHQLEVKPEHLGILPESSLGHLWTQFLHLVKDGYF